LKVFPLYTRHICNFNNQVRSTNRDNRVCDVYKSVTLTIEHYSYHDIQGSGRERTRERELVQLARLQNELRGYRHNTLDR